MAVADNIIQNLIDIGRLATADEIDMLIAHVAQAPFATYLARVPKDLRELLQEQGILTAVKLPSVEWHLLKRIYDEFCSGRWMQRLTAIFPTYIKRCCIQMLVCGPIVIAVVPMPALWRHLIYKMYRDLCPISLWPTIRSLARLLLVIRPVVMQLYLIEIVALSNVIGEKDALSRFNPCRHYPSAY